MDAYKIVEWLEHYEVTEKSKPATAQTPIESLRVSKLPYLRWKNNGHSLGPAYRRMNKKAWQFGNAMQPATFGVFGKLIELAADQKRPFRGWILDERQRPMTDKMIAELLEWDVDVVARAMEILTDESVKWLEILEFPLIPPDSRNEGEPCRQESPAFGGELGGPLYKKNENETKGKTNESKPDSVFSSLDSVSDSVKAARGRAILKVCELLKISAANKSDITTIRDIFDQIEDAIWTGRLDNKIFDCIVDEAKEAAGHRLTKWGRFINAMKRKPFQYQPVRRQILT